MATFKRLRLVQDRHNGPVIKIGNLARGAVDRRQFLNQNGSYLFKTKESGRDVALEVVVSGGQAKAKIPFNGETLQVPLMDVVRSIKTDGAGRPVRV
jgi:hypothetical protein